jgi:hypothetical protein
MTNATTVIDTVVNDYLWRVQAALRHVPAARGREIVTELSEHIREAREDGAVATETDARNLVDRLGDPADIAAEAQRRFGRLTRPAAGGREIGALLLLGIGGLVLPVISWVGGILLLWTSESWNRRDKILGTVLTLGAAPGLLLLGALGSVHVTGGGGGDGSGGLSVVLPNLVLFGFLILPLLTALYLLVRLRRARQLPAGA